MTVQLANLVISALGGVVTYTLLRWHHTKSQKHPKTTH